MVGCELSKAARRAPDLTATDVAPARGATATDAREAALLTYAVGALTEPAALTDADIDELHRHGWSDRALADAVGLVALNQLTGSFNLVAGLASATSAVSAA